MMLRGVAGLSDRRALVVVVGSGPVGMALAAELVARKIPVLLLESGDRSANRAIQALSDADRDDPAHQDDMAVAVARRLGGTSNLWGARCLPYDPIDFAPRDFVDARWPIGYQDLSPYWARAVAATCSGAPVYTDEGLAHNPGVPAGEFSVNRLERWANIQAAQNVHKDVIHKSPLLELRLCASVVGLAFDEAGAVTGLDVADSRTGERVHVAAQHVVLACGGLETARLLLNTQTTAPERFGGRNGPLGRYYMGHLMGDIATISFTNPASVSAFGFMVDRHGSYVRRRFVASDATQQARRLLNTAFWPVVPRIADARHGNAALSSVYLALSWPPLGRRLIADAIRQKHVPPGGVPIVPHISNILRGFPQSISFAASYIFKRYCDAHRLPGFFMPNLSNSYGLGFHAEQSPQSSSKVSLLGTVDRLGYFKLSVSLRFSDFDVESLLRSHDALENWLVRTGFGRLCYAMPREERSAAIWQQLSHGTHQIGLVRMGGSRQDGVVDANLSCFDSPNLYVASCAVLPTSGQANPTLTAIALAVRLADRLVGRLSGAPSASLPTGVDGSPVA